MTNGTGGQQVLLNLEHAISTGNNWTILLSSILVLSSFVRVVSSAIGVVAVFKHKALRACKDMLLMGFLFLFDLIQGLHGLCMFSFHYGTSNTRLACLFTVRNITHVLGTHSSVLMLMLVSIDRLLAVCAPLWYFAQSSKYTLKLVGSFGLISVCVAIVDLCYVFSHPHEIVPFCLTTKTFLFGFTLHANLSQVWMYGSIVLYGLVIVFYRKHRHSRINIQPSENPTEQELKQWKSYNERTRSVTVTMGLSALFTLLLYALSFSAWGSLRKGFPSLQVYGWMMLAPNEWSVLANLLLFLKRDREFRKAAMAMVTCHKLPDNIENWFVARPTRSIGHKSYQSKNQREQVF